MVWRGDGDYARRSGGTGAGGGQQAGLPACQVGGWGPAAVHPFTAEMPGECWMSCVFLCSMYSM